MPNPTRPGVVPIWTVGNTPARTQPSNGEQFAGFAPNFRPPAEWHNWLFGVSSDWIAWLDYVTANAAVFPVSNVGHTIATATNLQGQLDQLDAYLASIGFKQGGLVGSVTSTDGTDGNGVFTLPFTPASQDALVVFFDGGIKAETSDWTYALVSNVPTVTFTAGSHPITGQVPYAAGLVGNGSGGGGGGGGGGVNGGSTYTVVTITGPTHSIALSEGFVNVDATAAPNTTTLPVAASANAAGKSNIFTVTKIDPTANTVTVVPAGGDVILGLASAVLVAQGNSVTFFTDGVKWYVQ